MKSSKRTRRSLGILGVAGAMAMLLAPLLMPAAPVSASLCISPVDGPGDTAVADVAEAPVAPEDFSERGNSMTNEAGKLAAWEAHFNSPVVDGPEACD